LAGPTGRASDFADEVTLSLKGAKSPTRDRKPRSTGTKARAHVSDGLNSVIELKKQLEARTRELAEARGHLSEALEQQTATSEVLRVISSSPGELEPVFEAMLANATRICEAKFGVLFHCDGDMFHAAAWVGVLPPVYEDSLRQRGSFRPAAGAPLDRLLQSEQLVHAVDEAAVDSPSPAAKYGGARSLVAVPMRKETQLIGAFVIYRTEVRPFSQKQIELVTNFAAQAVIAIENTRLLNELRQRTDDLTEALEQQTAASEVLRVISSSPGDLVPVFEAILANATRICEAQFGNLFLYEGDAFRAGALHGAPPAYAEHWRQHPVVDLNDHPLIPLARLAETNKHGHIADLRGERGYIERDPVFVTLVEDAQARTMLLVPMLKESELVGAIVIYRQEVRPFSDKQIELLTNFAAQAVIAIENTRLLKELRESLQQQIATSDVLKLISRSTFDLQAVFNTLLESAAQLCAAEHSCLCDDKADTSVGLRAMAMRLKCTHGSGIISTLGRPSP
jgi:GAF domain-containing protein